ncbi:hypothetical protein O181_026452 [Austropuccinia psidii MF-1]|uniref:U2 small nuclear ribonucleoprotein A' n=1 Tax=Austropuccinia psidii MF-1 TaxID=1389203 RepID=A0A9Q3CQL5_9BASI|nr:hypothetical protein [Austropuccinia psidii MF-1]
MPRMSPELLLSKHFYLNPLKDRELDLRGYQIPAIENLGVTKDSLDSIDLTDNAIRSLINFPKMIRLKHLYLSNNPVNFISPNLPHSLPNLNSLVLSNCNLSSLNQLSLILKQFKRLEFLVLIGNPVCKTKLYRDWCIYNCPKVRLLDYRRVKEKERNTSLELFYDPILKGPTPIAQRLSVPEATEGEFIDDSNMISSDRIHSNVEPGQMGRTLTPEERARIKRSIEEATSIEEVRRLKRMLEQGFIPREDRKAPTSTLNNPKDSEMDVDVPQQPLGPSDVADHTKNTEEFETENQEQTETNVNMDVDNVAEKPTKKRGAKPSRAKAVRTTRSKRGKGAHDEAAD